MKLLLDEKTAGDTVLAGSQVLDEPARGGTELRVVLVGVDPDVGVEINEHQAERAAASRS